MAVLCFSLYCWGKENLLEGIFALCCVRLARSQDVGGCEDVILTSDICIVCVSLWMCYCSRGYIYFWPPVRKRDGSSVVSVVVAFGIAGLWNLLWTYIWMAYCCERFHFVMLCSQSCHLAGVCSGY